MIGQRIGRYANLSSKRKRGTPRGATAGPSSSAPANTARQAGHRALRDRGARGLICAGLVLLVLLLLCGPACATESDAPKSAAAEKYTLRYKFQPGETLRWNVEHRCKVRTTVSNSTQTAETTSLSEKVWRVRQVLSDGSATFEHLVQWVDMRQTLTGRREVHYDSRADSVPPRGFEQLAQTVGVPLSIVTLDARGKVLHRKRAPLKAAAGGEGEMTIQLPEEPIAVGGQWSSCHDVELPQPGGGVVKIKTRQVFALEGVKTGVATIRVATQILSPVHDPAIASQLIQYQSAGTVRFDIDAGRVLGQQMDVDKGVVGFRGEASSIHYLTRFTEEFSPGETAVAARPVSGK